MKRLLVSLFVGSLVATAVGVVPASAADIVKYRMYDRGALVSVAEVRGDLWITTELGMSEVADAPNVARSPFLHLNQNAYTYNPETGDIGGFVWSAYTEVVSDLQMTVAGDLSSATASTDNARLERCDAAACTPSTERITATFEAIGPLLRFHQNAISTVSRQSRFVYHSSGPSRFASATVTVGSETFGPFSAPAATIFDTRTGYIEATLVPFGTTAPAPVNGVVSYGTTAPGVGQQAGSAVQASWSSTEEGITIQTFVSASSRRVNSNGTFSDVKLAFYLEEIYATDSEGNSSLLSSTFSLEGATPDSVIVDPVLRSGSIRASALPVMTCTAPDGDTVCVNSTVDVDLSMVGFGDTTKTMDGGNAGVAGFWTETSHGISTTRQATASGTIDGLDLGPVQSGQLDQFRQGYRRVDIRPIS